MSFQDNLKTARKSRQLSQEELAELLNVSRQAVSKWEQGICMPEAQMLMRISEKLDISLDRLMSDPADIFDHDSEGGSSKKKAAIEKDNCNQKQPRNRALKAFIISGCAIILCIGAVAAFKTHTHEIKSENQIPIPGPVVEKESEKSTPPLQQAAETSEDAPAETSEDNAVFTTKQDRRILSELSADFASAYFAQDVDAIAPFLSPAFVGSPKDVSPWEGIDAFLVKGVDSISSEKADGTKRISIEFRNPDYPDSLLYLTVELVKENDEWKVHSYYLEP